MCRGDGLGGDRPGEAEIGHLHLPVRADQHVLGLHVTVHQPGFVGGRQGRHDGLNEFQGAGRAEGRLAGDQIAQRATLDELHDDIGAAMVTSLVEDTHHMGI